MRKQAVIIHSGGMDSSLCLALASREFGKENVLSVTFQYGQRHNVELDHAERIAQDWGIDHTVLNIDCLAAITQDALTHHNLAIEHKPGQLPNTLVLGRNGLMARVAAIHAHNLGARYVYMGVIEVEGSNSGYRDCSRAYMDLKQQILRIDLGVPNFEIRTPLVKMSKKETLELAHRLGILEYLLDKTVTCYEGIPHLGCRACPACALRNEGIRQFRHAHPDISLPQWTSSLSIC